MTLLVNVMPVLVKIVFAVPADLAALHAASKYSVTVDTFDAEPLMVGVRLFPGFPVLTDVNVNVGTVLSYDTELSDDVDA